MVERSRWLAGLFLLVFAAELAQAQLKSLETENLRLIYLDPLQTYLTPHVARCFESSMTFQQELFGYEPSERVTVILSDLSDYGAASAGAVPRDNLRIDVAPLSFAFETMPPGERLSMIMNHELVHVVSMDQAAGSDRFFRKLFAGKVLPIAEHPETIAYLYLTTPRVAVPSWYQEGTAVFMETWMAGGLGRAQGAYDEMVFRAMVRDDSHFYGPLGLVSEGTRIDFQVGINAYLYGTRFVSYLAYHYGPESVVAWVARTPGSKKYYASQFRQVFGMPLEQAWQDWIEWEHEFQKSNLEKIRRWPTTPYESLSGRALGSVSRAYYDAEIGKVLAAFNYPGVVAHLGSIDLEDGSLERLLPVKAPSIYTVTSLSYDPERKVIYYTTDNSAMRDLRSFDTQTGKARRLIKDARVGDLAFNAADRSLWGVRHFNGIATVVRIAEPYEQWNQVHSWPYGEVIYDLDVSPDGRWLSGSFAEINGRHTLRVFEIEALLEGDTTPIAEVDFASTIPSNFVFDGDGRYLYGSSYYTGVSNIFRYELASDELEAVSNSETGFFRPIPLGDDELIVFRYTGEGFTPVRIRAEPLEDLGTITFLGQQVVEKYPQLTEWVAASPASIPLDERIERNDKYRSFRSIGLEAIYPVIEGYREFAAIGFSADFSDPMFLNRISLSASYTPDTDLPDNERTHLRVNYQRRNWRANFWLNGADFYDLFGPTKTSRKGHSIGLGYTKSLIRDLPRQLDLNLETNFYGNMDQLPRYQNVDVTFDTLLEGIGQLTYRNLKASLGAVDYEKGIKAEAIVGASYVEDDLIPAFIGNLDLGLPLPLRHSSVWWRSSFGVAFGELDDPFANFFFGGFGNNWVDHRSIRRYREFYAFPGAELNQIGGRNYIKQTGEWNLPPVLFRNVGSPGFYLTWARASLFASGIVTNLEQGSAERRVADLGGQIDFRLTVLSKLDMTLSIGLARAWDRQGADRDEFMMSLKVLR